MPIRIVVADDHQILREGLKALLGEDPECEVVGEAEDGRSAVDLAERLRPQVVLMDIGMPILNGIEATRKILASAPQTRVIILSMHSDRRYIARALQAGAAGYLLKDAAFDEISRAIRTVTDGRKYLSPAIAGAVIDEYLQKALPDAAKEKGAPLTSREREVLQLLAEGRSTKEIAGAIHVSVKTVESHRKNIMDKLEIHSIAELTKYAVRAGITSLE